MGLIANLDRRRKSEPLLYDDVRKLATAGSRHNESDARGVEGFQPGHVFQLALASAAAIAGRCRRGAAAGAGPPCLLPLDPRDHARPLRSRPRPARPDRRAPIRQGRHRQAADHRLSRKAPTASRRRANCSAAPMPASCFLSTGSPPRPARASRSARPEFLEAISVRHTANEPALGYRVLETRRRLKPEFASMPQAEIEAAARQGTREALLEDATHVVFAHSGDAMPIDPALVTDADLLIHDATFLQRARSPRADSRHHRRGARRRPARQRQDAGPLSPVDSLRPRHGHPGAARAGRRQRLHGRLLAARRTRVAAAAIERVR